MPGIDVTRTDENPQRTPALLGSLLLHGALLALVFIAVKTAPPLHIETEPVAVSIVSGEPNVAPALKSKQVAPPQAEESAPGLALPGLEAVEPKPAPAAAAPSPPVAPPRPQPTPRPVAKAAPPKPEALDLAKLSASLPKAQARPRSSLDLDSLSKSLPAKAAHPGSSALNLDALADSLPAGRRAGNGARGPARPETAAQARQATGAATGLSGNEIGALKAKLIRLWNPNCGVDGANTVIVKVRMHLAPTGMLSAAPEVSSTSGSPPGVVRAATERAISAVTRGAPFDEISPEHLKSMNDFLFTFNGQTACGSR